MYYCANFSDVWVDIRVLTKPKEASIDLYSSYGRKDHLFSLWSSRETYLATVGLPLPDPRGADKAEAGVVPSGCAVPSVGWLAFTAARLITASRGRGRQEGSHVSDIRVQVRNTSLYVLQCICRAHYFVRLNMTLALLLQNTTILKV